MSVVFSTWKHYTGSHALMYDETDQQFLYEAYSFFLIFLYEV
jgi:hypothetical protein